jgi:DNA-binding NarL/FixJ family response regulator
MNKASNEEFRELLDRVKRPNRKRHTWVGPPIDMPEHTDLLRLLSIGYTTLEIANACNVSTGTVSKWRYILTCEYGSVRYSFQARDILMRMAL